MEEIPSIQVILTSMPFEDSACHSHGGISSIRPKMVVSESSATGQEEAGGGVGWGGMGKASIRFSSMLVTLKTTIKVI